MNQLIHSFIKCKWKWKYKTFLALAIAPNTSQALDTVDSIKLGTAGLQLIDWALIVIYALATIALGLYYSRRQTSTEEYFIGNGKMNPTVIGISLFATLLSTISYLAMPGEASGKGPVVMSSFIALPMVYFVVGYLLLPIYMKRRVTSAYELLEGRLGLSIRLLGGVLFIALRLVWMTLLVYIAAKAMVIMMGIDAQWMPWIVLAIGVVSIIYTTLGGIRAVVITDCVQTVLMFGGALLVIAMVTYDFGGFSWVPTQWQPHWDAQPIISLDPKTRVTVVGTVLSIFVWYTATLGGDQTSIQRFMATENVIQARKALLIQLSTAFIIQLTLVIVGFAVLSYFQTHTDQLPATMSIKNNADELFPHYIAFHLPVGIAGLVVAAMFAAAMSSIDSGVNSITAVVSSDFLERFGWQAQTKRAHMFRVRLLALSIGAIVILSSSMMEYIEGNITAVTAKTVNLLTTPIFGLFFFALFVPRARAWHVWLATITSVIVAALIAFSGPLVYFLHTYFGIEPISLNSAFIIKTDAATGETWTTCEDPISFQWIGPIALLTSITVGLIAIRLFPSSRPVPLK
ncbi:MAG: sodium-coupled permease [Gammaproteobacteria bacterium]|nr:MAG: sodium-coupled permease [Gammaproteobacteria bacterium]